VITLLRAGMAQIERLLRVVAAGCLLAVMLIVFADVVARYLANAPLAWSYDLIGMYLMPALFYLALSDTLADHHHVAVDLLRPHMPGWLTRSVEVIGNAATAALFLVIAWIYFGSAVEKFRTDALVLSVGQWPAWIPDAIVALGAVVISLRLIGRAVGHALSLLLRRGLIDLPTSVQG
jgi:TRAP-type C4-dicarboxylate transport system permease small subunit